MIKFLAENYVDKKTFDYEHLSQDNLEIMKTLFCLSQD